ncbi:hypothetical protein FRB90_011206 [Tulasnella sp. 427]|nr:hypothetical protein FRB90_011206 [Tulasnella sp. 427]
MGRKKGAGKPKDQPVFRQPTISAAISERIDTGSSGSNANAADSHPPRRPHTPDLEALPEAPQGPSRQMRTLFGQSLVDMPPEERNEILALAEAQAAIPKNNLPPTLRKRLERMTKKWEDFCEVKEICKERWFHQSTFVDRSGAFINTMLLTTKGSKADGRIAYGTLAQWCSTLIQVISRYCVDDEGARTGSGVLRNGLLGHRQEKNLFSIIMDEAVALFHQYKLDKRIPRKALMGRYEAQRVIEEALTCTTCKEAAIMLSLSVAIATVTALRPGALGYSHPEWDGRDGRIGKFLKNRDIHIQRDLERGEGAFLVTLTAEHIKGRNGAEPFKPFEFKIRSLAEPQNVPFDPNNYLLPLLHRRGDLIDYVGRPYSEVLKGKELLIRVGNPDLPVFRQVKNGGYGMHDDPTVAASAQSINSRFSRVAEKAGLKPLGGRGVSFTGFRASLATEIADLYGEDVASMILGHQDEESLARKHYTAGIASWDLAGIVFGEITSGDKEHEKRARGLNLIRRPAVRLAMLEQMEAIANEFDPLSEEDPEAVTDVDNTGHTQDQNISVGSKRKRDIEQSLKKKTTSIARKNLDTPEELKIVQDLATAIPKVKELKDKADAAWNDFCNMTAERPQRGNDWRRFLTQEGDEEIPSDWDASGLPSSWGTAKARQTFCTRYEELNKLYSAAFKKAIRKVRDERRKERSQQVEQKKDAVTLAAAQCAEEQLSAPSHLLHHVVPTSTSTEVQPQADTDLNPTTTDDNEPDIQSLEDDAEARFFLGIQSPSDEPTEKSHLLSKIHSIIYGRASPGKASASGSPLPIKGKGTINKGKGKSKAQAVAEVVQWQDSEEGDDDGVRLLETSKTAFDDRRLKELQHVLKQGEPDQFRTGWQLFLSDLMTTDQELVNQRCPKCPESETVYSRWRLRRHLDSVHTTLDAHFNGIGWEQFVKNTRTSESAERWKCPFCNKPKSWTDPVDVLIHVKRFCKMTKTSRPTKRLEKSLLSSTSSKSTDVAMAAETSSRKALMEFRRGNTPSQPSTSSLVMNKDPKSDRGSSSTTTIKASNPNLGVEYPQQASSSKTYVFPNPITSRELRSRTTSRSQQTVDLDNDPMSDVHSGSDDDKAYLPCNDESDGMDEDEEADGEEGWSDEEA